MKINFGTFVPLIQVNNSSLPIPILFGPTHQGVTNFLLAGEFSGEVNIIVWNMRVLYTKDSSIVYGNQ